MPKNEVIKALELNVYKSIAHLTLKGHAIALNTAENERIECEKRKFIEDSGLTIYRYHDHPHYTTPDQIAAGQLRQFGLKGRIEYTDVFDLVRVHLDEPMTVESISRNTHISVSGIYKTMKQAYGKTLGEYILELRISRAEALLKEENTSIEKVAEAVGFSDSAYFSRCFKKSRGISPMKYKKLLKEM